jgi:hypothetical protein
VIVAWVASVSARRQKSVRLLRSSAAALATSFLVAASTRKPRREPRVRRFSGFIEDEVRDMTIPPIFDPNTVYVQWYNKSRGAFCPLPNNPRLKRGPARLCTVFCLGRFVDEQVEGNNAISLDICQVLKNILSCSTTHCTTGYVEYPANGAVVDARARLHCPPVCADSS